MKRSTGESAASDGENPEKGKGAFPKTRWSLLLNAADRDPAALAELCQSYWYPIYAYARRSGSEIEDAEDLTQAFFAKLLATDFLSRARASQGRLRTFLLTAFRNFTRDEWKRGQAAKRSTGVPVSIDAVSAEAWLAMEPADTVTPELEYERSWAREILRLSRERLRDSYAEADKQTEFALLQDHLEPDGGRPYADLAADLGVKEARVRYLVFKLRQRFSHFLRLSVSETVDSPEAAEEELAHLRTLFQAPGP